IVKSLFTQEYKVQTEGGSFSGSSDNSTPPPSVAVTSDTYAVSLDRSTNTASFNLSWSSSGAYNCIASANPNDSNFSGPVQASKTNYNVTVSAPGTYKYTVTCTNVWGSNNSSGTATVTAVALKPAVNLLING